MRKASRRDIARVQRSDEDSARDQAPADPPAVTPQEQLTVLARRIQQNNAEAQSRGRQAVTAATAAMQYALQAGRDLLTAKKIIGHGGFGRWLNGIGIATRTAQYYMKAARLVDSGQVNPQSLARLSVRQIFASHFQPTTPRPDALIANSPSKPTLTHKGDSETVTNWEKARDEYVRRSRQLGRVLRRKSIDGRVRDRVRASARAVVVETWPLHMRDADGR